MEFLQNALAYIVDLGSYIFVPILMMLLGLIFGLKLLDAIKSGATVGIGLIGVSIVGGLVADSLSPVIDAFVKRFNLNLSAIDIGGGPAAATGFGFSLSAIIILVIVIVNILLVAGKFTNTVNVDIYNFWYYCITAGFVYGLTKSAIFSIISAVSHAVLGYVFADLNAKKTEEVIGIEGVSIPHGFAAASAPLFMLLDKIYDKIPFFDFKDEDEFEEEKDNKLFSLISTVFGDPLFLGLLMGLIFGISAQYN
ncbi:MAG: PTS transporter subunit IIC, partial [Anaerococcus obesiensis]